MQPQKYERTTDFTERDGDDTDHTAINEEFDAVALPINQVRENLALIQRDDGALKNGIVKIETIDESVFLAINESVAAEANRAEAAANTSIEYAEVSRSEKELAQIAKDAAETARDASLLNANTAASKATESAQQATASASSASAAQGFRNEAQGFRDQAQQSAQAANSSRLLAQDAADDALAIYGSTTEMNDAVTSAINSANTATTQAGVATAKAAEATTKAAEATAQAGIATAKAAESSSSADSSTQAKNEAQSILDTVRTISGMSVSGILGGEKSAGEIFQSAVPLKLGQAAVIVTGADGDKWTVQYLNDQALLSYQQYAKATFGGTTGAVAPYEFVAKNLVKVSGSTQVDHVYINQGAYCDFVQIGSGVDKAFLPGTLASYTATLIGSGSTIDLFRILEDGRLEGVYLNANTTDTFVFTDGQIATQTLKTALQNGTTPVLDTSVTYSGTPPSGLAVVDGIMPTNWLPADGSAVWRTHYPRLFAAIGTTYGVGDGATTFNLPAIDPADKSQMPHSGIAGIRTYIQT